MKKTILGCSLLLALSYATTGQATEERLVTVDHHALQVATTGEGPYTVVFEAGFGMPLNAWRNVVPEVSKRAKVITYSRAGTGKSEPGNAAHTLEQSVTELAQMLDATGAKPPYILVGHSYGGFIIRGFAASHPERVAGMVFVDPADEKQTLALRLLDAKRAAQDEAAIRSFIPPQFQADYELIDTRIQQTGQLPAFGALPDVPTVMLTSVKAEYPDFFAHSPQGIALRRISHELFMRQFSNGSQVLTSKSGHNIHRQEPELVIAAIERVLEMADATGKQMP